MEQNHGSLTWIELSLTKDCFLIMPFVAGPLEKIALGHLEEDHFLCMTQTNG